VYLSLYTLKAHRAQSPNCRNQTAVLVITFMARRFVSSDAKRPGSMWPGPLIGEGYSPQVSAR
jgi:hypothetical protein